MKIKITPETDLEKQKYKEVTHKGVQDFFIVGNKRDEDEFEDFNDWKGSYKFLMGNLYYFLNKITEEQNFKEGAKMASEMAPEMDVKPTSQFKPQLIKTGDTNDLKVINTEEIKAAMEKANNLPLATSPDEFTPQLEIAQKEPEANENND